MKKKYVYKGAVARYNTVIDPAWEAQTYADSEKQAVSNLKFQVRKKAGLEQFVKLALLGKPVLEDAK